MNILAILPELLLAIFGVLGILLGVFFKNNSYTSLMILAKIAIIISMSLLLLLPKDPTIIMNGFFINNYFVIIVKIFLLSGCLLYLVISHRSLVDNNLSHFEYPILIIFSLLGMMVMVSANDLLSLFMGLELQNLCLYTIVAFKRDSPLTSEAALKYFVMGAVASGILLFGISLVYGLTGVTNYASLAKFFEGGSQNAAVIIGVLFIFVGILFKLSLAPFHTWTPDVYEGAPTSITMFIASIPKMAALGVLANLAFYPFLNLINHWHFLLVSVAILSMVLGSLGALRQDNLKRLLAYSAISNMGFTIMGITTGITYGLHSSILYIFFYMLMILGVFACILNMSHRGHKINFLKDLRGIGKHYPGTAFAFTFIVFSLAGIPPLPGFFIKIYVLQSVLKQHAYGLAIVAILTSVVSAAYYLSIVKFTLLDKVTSEEMENRLNPKHSNYAIIFSLFIIIISLALVCINPDSLLIVLPN